MHTNTVDLKFRQKGIFVSPKSKQNPPKPPLGQNFDICEIYKQAKQTDWV